MQRKILVIVSKVEKTIIILLLFALLLVVAYSSLVLLERLFTGIIENAQDGSFEDSILMELNRVFQGFMLILIGIELLQSVKVYLIEKVVHVEVVLLVAMIAISRHMIGLDYEHIEPMAGIGMSLGLVALSASYFLVKKSNKAFGRDDKG